MSLMKKVFPVVVFFASALAFAGEGAPVPEFFYQPEENQTAAEFGANYGDSTESDTEMDVMGWRLSAMRGVTHGLALRLQTSYTYADDTNGGNGFNNFDLDVVGHSDVMGMNLHYGVFGSITPSKTGGDQRFTTAHSFSPYVGLSLGSEALMYGVRFTHETISTTSPVFGDNYIGSIFTELHKTDSYLAGISADYIQQASLDDAVDVTLYGRIYMNGFILLPRLNYLSQMDEALDDSYGVEIAARMLF